MSSSLLLSSLLKLPNFFSPSLPFTSITSSSNILGNPKTLIPGPRTTLQTGPWTTPTGHPLWTTIK